jgi:hypothetical protein
MSTSQMHPSNISVNIKNLVSRLTLNSPLNSHCDFPPSALTSGNNPDSAIHFPLFPRYQDTKDQALLVRRPGNSRYDSEHFRDGAGYPFSCILKTFVGKAGRYLGADEVRSGEVASFSGCLPTDQTLATSLHLHVFMAIFCSSAARVSKRTDMEVAAFRSLPYHNQFFTSLPFP